MMLGVPGYRLGQKTKAGSGCTLENAVEMKANGCENLSLPLGIAPLL